MGSTSECERSGRFRMIGERMRKVQIAAPQEFPATRSLGKRHARRVEDGAEERGAATRADGTPFERNTHWGRGVVSVR
jgi:hypothetical protein